jgi:hypothetical protein
LESNPCRQSRALGPVIRMTALAARTTTASCRRRRSEVEEMERGG